MKQWTLLLMSAIGFFCLFPGRASAQMSNYCQVPPYVIQDVPPNVMILLDNSLNMLNFAYFDGFTTTTTTDDNTCTASGSPCTGFTTPGVYPAYKYYGYYSPDHWYTYTSNRFLTTAATAAKTGSGLPGARAKTASEWDGNFLNWLTMRRLDIVRRVMSGGKTTSGEGSGFDRLIGEEADSSTRGIYKRIVSAGDYTSYTGNRKITFSTGSGTSSFTVRNVADTGNDATFSVAIRTPSPVEGVVQSVVGTRARLGLSFYNANNEGGEIRVVVGGGSLPSTINQINGNRPSANTPMAEALWTVTGYFAQQTSIAGGPGPRYNNGDFQTNNNNDPYNYGTGGSPRWPSCATSFVLLVSAGEPCADGNLPASLANYANTRSNYNCQGANCPAVAPFPATALPACPASGNVAGIEDIALYARTTDLRNSPTLGVNNIARTQNLTLYTVFAFGTGSTLLRYAAINGGFEDSNANNIPDLQSEWDSDGDNEPDTFYEATEGYALETSIRNALSNMLRRASSGTAASVLASGEGSGANLTQGIFYPRRRFGNDVAAWVGELHNLWFHVDPLFANSSLREDTDRDINYDPYELNLAEDYIVQSFFDTVSQTTKIRRYRDSDGDGDPDLLLETVPFEEVASIWKAGELLWGRNLVADGRTMYTTINGTSRINFSTANAATLRPYLQAATNADAELIIRYTHGEDLIQDADLDGTNDYRSRTVTIDGATNVWKFGDIINSTPRIASWLPLNNYHLVYTDTSYQAFITTTGATGYTERGMVFTAGNDGMLHALKLGQFELVDDPLIKARLTGSDVGKEMWSFIPKHALPYLKYIADPDYCHVHTVDLSPYIFDTSIGAPGSGDISAGLKPDDGSTWRTVLIGAMRQGGACRKVCAAGADCVQTPLNDPSDSSKGLGYSSYFALDVTDLSNPQLLWEFSNDALGFSTTGPAIVRVGARDKNGKWFAVIGSGPTGPISNFQFFGRSDQTLKFFVLDLKTGALVRAIDTGIANAFAGSLTNSTDDPELDYQDDVIYVGYVKKVPSGTTWTEGGVGRLVTKENSDPTQWVWSKVIEGNDADNVNDIGPVTSAITKIQNTRTQTLWLSFGSGRYYFEDAGIVDDPDSQRRIFGMKEPCFISGALDPNCTTTRTLVDRVLPGTPGFVNVTTVGAALADSTPADYYGWYINLDPTGSYTYAPEAATNYKAERVITDPLASLIGVTFFTSFKPYGDECGIGGKSFIWAVKYDTGGAPGALLKGKALIQLSTGSIEQMNLGDAFTAGGGRKTSALEGVPPTGQGLNLLTTPSPIKRIFHGKER